jgi:hypothetical protein
MSFTMTSGNPFLDDKQIAPIKKDLRTYLTGCQKQTQMFFRMTQFMTNPRLTDVDEELVRIWGAIAMREVWEDLGSNRKKRIDGKEWNVGFMGSVWKDVELAGIQTRICYYSRKMNAGTMKNITNPEIKYVVMLDPHSMEGFR